MKTEPITPEEQELARIWPERWGPKRFLKTCTARDAETGKPCTRHEHADHNHSASGRPFTFVLAPGATPRRELDLYAGGRLENPMGVL